MRLTSRNTATRKVTVRSSTAHIPCRLTLLRERVALGFLAAILTIALPNIAAAQASAPSLKLSPETIQMGAFYNGAKVRIEGTAPAGSQVLVVIRGDENDEFFNKKGRVGPIWVNTDRIHVTAAPSLFLSFSSADVSSLLDRTSIEAYQLDEQAIKNRLACRSHCKCSTTARHAHRVRESCGVCGGGTRSTVSRTHSQQLLSFEIPRGPLPNAPRCSSNGERGRRRQPLHRGPELAKERAARLLPRGNVCL